MSTAIIVAAIDFGTTYSGWAFSFRHEYDADPTKISAKQWIGGQLVSLKAPTCVLIKPDGKTLAAFGYEAEDKYAELAEDGNHRQWYFFKRFKMMLFDKMGLSRNILLDDNYGKQIPAKTVFSLAIRYLKDDLLKMSKGRISGGGLQEGDIQWVLTVPAIWDDAAKQFMREAAVEAGIETEKLKIALEPEAASLFCRHLPVEKCVGPDKMSLSKFTPGTKYLVLDAGGGTVDITVHEVQRGGTLKELHKASGGAWGGTKVDESFRQFYIKLIGGPVMKKFQNKHMDDYLDMFREFEIKKRDIKPDSDRRINFRLPTAMVDTFEDETDENLREVIPQTSYANKITCTGDKMRVDVEIGKGFFNEALSSIVDHLQKLLREPANKGVSAIVMVGGFSESPMLQDAIRRKFPGMKLIIPEDAGLAVLKGAVIYGHSPTTISERVCKYTYGIQTTSAFMEGQHPQIKKVLLGGQYQCDDIFSIHAKVGQTVKIGEALEEQSYWPTDKNQKALGFPIFRSTNPSPSFTTDAGCQLLGKLSVDCPPGDCTNDQGVDVKLIFGGTELEVVATAKHTGKVTKASFDFLGK